MADRPTDLYMQWFAVRAKTHATGSDSLQETRVTTGLSIGGPFCWLIHMLTIQIPANVLDDNRAAAWILAAAVSRRNGATVMQYPDDPGYTAGWVIEHDLHTQGGIARILPAQARENFLPPMPYAAPSLSIYLQTANDVSVWRGVDVHVRIGFTTVPLDAKTYLEIAETWGYQQS